MLSRTSRARPIASPRPRAADVTVTGKNGAGANFTRTVNSVAITDNILTLGLTAALPNAGTRAGRLRGAAHGPGAA